MGLHLGFWGWEKGRAGEGGLAACDELGMHFHWVLSQLLYQPCEIKFFFAFSLAWEGNRFANRVPEYSVGELHWSTIPCWEVASLGGASGLQLDFLELEHVANEEERSTRSESGEIPMVIKS